MAFIDPSSNFNSFTVILKLASTPSISIKRSENKNKRLEYIEIQNTYAFKIHLFIFNFYNS